MDEWIVPCNIKYYDVINAFKKLSVLDWKQSNPKIEVGDIVYIYIGNPIKSIKYKCKVQKVNLSSIEIDDSEFILNGERYENYGRHMELKLLSSYDNELTLEILRNCSLVGNIQCTRRMSAEIQKYIIDNNID